MATCEYCNCENEHHALCPMTFIASEPNRLIAFNQGVPVCTSDWVDAAFMAANGRKNSRDVLTDMFVLHHRWVERTTSAPLRAEIAALTAAPSSKA